MTHSTTLPLSFLCPLTMIPHTVGSRSLAAASKAKRSQSFKAFYAVSISSLIFTLSFS
jgi:hypothetical protein